MIHHAPVMGEAWPFANLFKLPPDLAPLWVRFITLCESIEFVDFEMLTEDFAIFRAMVRSLAIGGVPFDAGFLQHVENLNADAIGSADDCDDDISVDDGQELDDGEQFGAEECEYTNLM